MVTMNLTPERQGYLGDVLSKTLPELKELLERQEKILSRKKFLDHLPDKGEKTKKFAEYLREVISCRASTALLQENAGGPVASQIQPTQTTSYAVNMKTSVPCAAVPEEKDDGGTGKSNVSEAELVSGLQNVRLGEPMDTRIVPSVQNSYERVIKKADQSHLKDKVEKFMPNRSLKNDSLAKLHVQPPPKPMTKAARYTEESAAKPPDYEYKEAKIISIEESVKLIEEQRIRNEELMAEQAAQRLAAQLAPKMKQYNPDTVDLRYREPEAEREEDAIDSDDDEEDEDDYNR